MPTVLISDGYKFMIYTQDHKPPHVHVLNRGCEAIIEFEDGIGIRSNYGFSRREMRAILSIVKSNKEFLIDEWRGIHG